MRKSSSWDVLFFIDKAHMILYTENAIFTLMHKAFLEGFKAGKMASESIDRMSMYYKGRIDARIANAGLAEKANGQNNID